jgi:hypothetical protein
MARPARRDRAHVVDATLTLRLTSEDRALLDALVGLRNADLAVEGMEATAASYVRGLIRREAVAKGLLDPQSLVQSERRPVQRVRAAKS